MKMGFAIYKGTKEDVEDKMESMKAKAKEGYPNSYLETKDGFELKTEEIKINFSADKYLAAEYAIYQIFY